MGYKFLYSYKIVHYSLFVIHCLMQFACPHAVQLNLLLE